MSLFPDFERALVEAAVREPRRRRRQLSRVIASSAAALALTGALLAFDPFAIGGSDNGQRSRAVPADRTPSDCPRGRAPSGVDRWRPLDSRPIRSLTVLGCGRLTDGREIELVARRLRSGHVCLDVYVPSARAALECAAAPAKRPAIAVGAFAPPGRPARRLGGGPLVAGWTAGAVAQVEIRYRDEAGPQRLRATLIRVLDRPAIVAAGGRERFGVFVFVSPARMLEGQLRGYDARGRWAHAARPPTLLPVQSPRLP